MGSLLFLQALSLEEAMISDSKAMRFLVDTSDQSGNVGIVWEQNRAEVITLWDNNADFGISGMVARFVAPNDWNINFG